MQSKFSQLKDIFELAITENFQLKSGRHFCRLAEDCQKLEVNLDFYTRLISGKNRRYRKNVSIGDFEITEYGIIYHHTHHKPSYLSRIKTYLKESKIPYKMIGNFLFFENEENPLPEKDAYYIEYNTVMIRLPYTEIKGVFVPSNRTNRIFVVSQHKIYAENRTKGTTLNSNIQERLLSSAHTLKIDLDSIPMLFLARYSHTYEDVEKLYAEKIVNALTS